MYINKPVFIEEIYNGEYNGINNQCARGLGVSAQQLRNFVNSDSAQAGPYLLGCLAVYCRRKGLDFWDFIILPKVLTIVDGFEEVRGV